MYIVQKRYGEEAMDTVEKLHIHFFYYSSLLRQQSDLFITILAIGIAQFKTSLFNNFAPLFLFVILHSIFINFHVSSRNNEEVDVILEEKSYQGETLKGPKPSLAFKADLIDKLILALEKRFPSTEIVEASLILDFKMWPKNTEHDDILGGQKLNLFNLLFFFLF